MAVGTKDYYQTLGVSKTATQKEISAAFRKLARQHHPDVSKDPKASEKFKEINEAYSILHDEEKRKKYDEFGSNFAAYEGFEHAGRPGGGFSNQGPQAQFHNMSPEEMQSVFGGFDFGNIFAQAQFGGGGFDFGQHTAAARKGQNVEGELTISLEEAFSGTARTAQMDGKAVEVRIPAGIRDGAKVRAAGQGAPGARGAKAGDLLIAIHIATHSKFVRRGDDLETKVEVPLKTALLGGEVHVPTLSGKGVALTVPPETQNGTRLRMRGLGMPKLKDGGNGDLYAEVDIRLPLPLTDEMREAANKLAH
jgi:DnaJ-class molecular chaperone